MNQRNYQREMEGVLKENKEKYRIPTLLLHSCCAPCSSYVLEYLSEYFFITVYYYNPNIYPEEEYGKRVKEQQEFIRRFPMKHEVKFVEGTFEKERFYATVKGLEQEKEGGARCAKCYELRLESAAEFAKEHGFDYFATTLSISPLKNAEKLNEIGERLGREYGISYLVSDFKKKNGYKRSVEISKEYDMYRQYYCGCVFSKKQRDDEIADKKISEREEN